MNENKTKIQIPNERNQHDSIITKTKTRKTPLKPKCAENNPLILNNQQMIRSPPRTEPELKPNIPKQTNKRNQPTRMNKNNSEPTENITLKHLQNENKIPHVHNKIDHKTFFEKMLK